jgi:cyclic pyranopterin phosphate synthase
MKSLTHLDKSGSVRMVDVSEKKISLRAAVAQSRVVMKPETFRNIFEGHMSKGNVLETARIAGITAAKKTWDIIPLCHPLPLTHVRVDFFPETARHCLRIEAQVRVRGRTGVEMEALVAAAVAGLAVYDMCKAQDKTMTVSDITLLKKSGGRSGVFIAGD